MIIIKRWFGSNFLLAYWRYYSTVFWLLVLLLSVKLFAISRFFPLDAFKILHSPYLEFFSFTLICLEIDFSFFLFNLRFVGLLKCMDGYLLLVPQNYQPLILQMFYLCHFVFLFLKLQFKCMLHLLTLSFFLSSIISIILSLCTVFLWISFDLSSDSLIFSLAVSNLLLKLCVEFLILLV